MRATLAYRDGAWVATPFLNQDFSMLVPLAAALAASWSGSGTRRPRRPARPANSLSWTIKPRLLRSLDLFTPN